MRTTSDGGVSTGATRSSQVKAYEIEYRLKLDQEPA
jgi:hypothetical protein